MGVVHEEQDWSTGQLPSFDDADLIDRIDAAPIDVFDRLEFGLIVMDRSGVVIGYNRYEAERAGLSPERVLGRNFFTTVGPCTNNAVVAGRFRDPGALLDVSLDYVFTLRMKVTPVRLRLMARAGSDRQYMAVVAP